MLSNCLIFWLSRLRSVLYDVRWQSFQFLCIHTDIWVHFASTKTNFNQIPASLSGGNHNEDEHHRITSSFTKPYTHVCLP